MTSSQRASVPNPPHGAATARGLPLTATQIHAVGVPGYSETWPCEPQTAGHARALVRAALHTWALDSLLDRATLIVSELVSNAVRHSGGRLVRVSVIRPAWDVVGVSVSDKSTAPPVKRTSDPEAESGRGLLLVEALADRWETDTRRWGKVVRAELHVRPDA
ncbi:ATP-binding protein [Streptomyces sp. JJ66]|uniref:ATP-binding protein n=1 Tax=Streptomyces sp. JJ66 TaxID=2803843 RepID=UPI001C59A16E|nr:ATP-binding protein [Streptomyces sp. JJ66]MBW1603103.1 ATP-binding protein [Streptomyces sp. JJ66]